MTDQISLGILNYGLIRIPEEVVKLTISLLEVNGEEIWLGILFSSQLKEIDGLDLLDNILSVLF